MEKKRYNKKWSCKWKATMNRKQLTMNRKRGPLSKLMNEEEKQKAGIHELSYDFGCSILRLNYGQREIWNH